MGAPREFDDGAAVSSSDKPIVRVPPPSGAIQRQVLFWLAALAVFIMMLWLLAEILLPFVAGLAIAYLLAPLTDRM